MADETVRDRILRIYGGAPGTGVLQAGYGPINTKKKKPEEETEEIDNYWEHYRPEALTKEKLDNDFRRNQRMRAVVGPVNYLSAMTQKGDWSDQFDYQTLTNIAYDKVTKDWSTPYTQKRSRFYRILENEYGSVYDFKLEDFDSEEFEDYDDDYTFTENEVKRYLYDFYTEMAKFDEARVSKLIDKNDIQDFYNEKKDEGDFIENFAGREGLTLPGGHVIMSQEDVFKRADMLTGDNDASLISYPILESMMETAPVAEERNAQRDEAIYNYGWLAEGLRAGGVSPAYNPDEINADKFLYETQATKLYGEINNSKNYGDGYTGGGDVQWFMYPGEKAIYNILMNAQKFDEALAFYKEIQPALEVRARIWDTQKEAEWAEEHPWLATAKGIVGKPFVSIGATIDDIGDIVTGQDINAFDMTSRSLNRANVGVSTVANNISEKYGNLAGESYTLGVTVGENMVRHLISSATGGLTGSVTAAKAVSYSLMFESVYSNTVDDMLMRGASSSQAVLGGLFMGGVEMLTERFTIGEILNGKISPSVGKWATFKNAFKKGIASFVPNAAEEMSAEFLGMVVDAAVMQHNSESSTRARELVLQGMSEEEANTQVFKENFDRIVKSGISGGISGGVTTGITNTMNYLLGKADSRNVFITQMGEKVVNNPTALSNVIDLGLKNGNENFARISDSMARGQMPDAEVVGNAMADLVIKSTENNGGLMGIMELITAIDGKPASYMGSMEAVDTAKAVAKMVQGKATNTDKALISRSDGATMVLTALEGDKTAWKNVKTTTAKELVDTTPSTDTSVETAIDDAHAVVKDGEVFDKKGNKLTISEKSDIDNGVVVNNEAKRMKETDSEGYSVAERLGDSLKKPVKFVKELFDAEGKMLDGVETDSGIFINTSAKNPIKWAVTHEFSHTMKKSAGKTWSKYQNFVVDYLKKNGKYYKLFDAKAKAYGTTDANYINEEIAADFIGETFSSVDELAKFIKKDRGLAETVRDIYYKVLDKLGLVDEKKKAQLMWRDACRKAVLNVKEGKVESKPAEKKSVSGTRSSDLKNSSDGGKINGEQFRTMWTIEEGVLSNKEVRQFYSEIQNLANGSKKYETSVYGDYIFEIENKLVYTDGDFEKPTISKVIEFDSEYESDIAFAKELILNEERTQSEIADAFQLIEEMYGYGFVFERNFEDSEAYARQRKRGKGTDSKTTDSGTRKSISGTRLEDIENLASSAGVDLDKAIKKGITKQEFKKAALDIRKEFDSKIKQAELTKDLTDLYTFAQSDKSTPDMINQIASNIADKVVNNVTKTVTNDEYADLLKQIKDTKIMVPEAERADFKDGYESFRKGNMGKLNLVNDGLDLDVFWDNLTEQYPNLFDENILGSEERLERILEVRDTFSPKEQIVFETNDEIQSAKNKIANTILEKIVKTPATKEAENIGKFVESVEQKLDLTNKKTTRAGIDSDYNYLSQMVRNPTDAKHVPEDLRPAVARLLNCFNYETKSIEKLRAEGKEMDSPTAVRIDSMYNAYTDIIKKSWGIEATEDSQFADKFLSDDIKEMIGEIPANEDGGFKKLEDMSIDELRAMAKVLHSVHHMITQRNKAFNSAIDENISELGFNAAEDFKAIRNRRKGSGEKLDYNTTAIQKASRIVDKYFNYDNVQPWDFFHGMGGTMERLFMEERRAFNRHILNIKSASETISKATTGMDLDKLTGKGAEKVWFETDMGEKIRLSKGQILNLYALYGRKQGKEHILGGGVVLGTEAKDSTGDKISAHTAHAVTEADMGRLFEEHITEDEKAMVSQIVDFMSKECAKWGNETSMKLYGYEKFGENWYFPIKVSKVTLNQFSGKKGEGNQRTQSFTKSTTKNASNAVEIGDFFDTVTSHINGVSLYNTTALPMLDMERVLNYTESGTDTKVRADIIRTFGKNANSYIDKFHSDENGSTKTEKSNLEKFANFGKKTSIGFNARVLLQQPTSIARAYMFLSPKDIPQSLKGVALVKEMREVCPIAYWKSLGFRDIGTGSTMKDVLINNESLYNKLEMGGYGLADDLTWGMIYGAVKNETKRLNPDLKVGSEEFNNKVRDRFDYIVDRTQVVDSVFHRTQSMRSDNYLAKTTTMFMSESLKTYNLYRTEMIDAVREGRKFKTAARATAVFVTSNLLLALAQALPDTWREDDEKELFDENGNPISFADRYWKKFWGDFTDASMPATYLPIVKDVYSIIQGFTTERVEYSRLTDFIVAAKNIGNDKMSLPAKFLNITTTGAGIFGISVGNLKRDVFGIAETIMRENMDEYGDYLIDKFKYNVQNSSNKRKFMNHYERAISNGHPDDAAIILEDYLSENYEGEFDKEKAKPVIEEIANIYGEAKEDKNKLIFDTPSQKFSFDGEDVEISDKDYPEYVEGTYNTLFDLAYKMINDERYKDLPIEEKVRNFGELEQYAEQSQRPEYVEGYELDGGWKNDLYNGKINYMDNAMERYADRIYFDKKEEYKEGFDINESDYTETEYGVVESTINDWSGYLASKDLGREIDPSEDRYLIVYDEQLSDDMDIVEYAGVRAYAKKTAALYDLNDNNPNEGSDSLTKDELERYLDSTDYSWEVKGALFMSIGNSNWYNKYTGLKNNGEPLKSSGGGGGSSSGGSRGSSRTSSRTSTRSTGRTTRTTTRRSNR